MRKDRLYLFTFVAITLLFVIISTFAIRYFVDAAANKVIDTQLDVSKREVKQVALLIGNQLSHGIPKDSILIGVQASIENSDLESGFVTIFDWSGKVVCHPNITQLGKQLSHQESIINSISDEVSSDELYQLLERSEAEIQNGPLQRKDNSEIVNLYPVPNSDWIVAGHTNTSLLAAQIGDLRKKFLNILLVMGFIFILSSVIMVRIIGSRYEKMLEMKNERLSDEVINLTKLNSAVSEYQQRVIDQREDTQEEDAQGEDTNTKKRILTYIRHELVPIAIQEISYIYTENTITYVICQDGKKSTANSSLDELFSQLDQTIFFRANRQFIISISSIDKIMRYGNNQLKILINPESETDIIISKNRAAEFKQWLNL
ncbi:LytTR family transcriptional regulator [Aureisphaera galaxeae]|uniref:LytTR family transcriptional regulator n=1 Tax=Aureisphaera galaxeae TaxID=1538023 RepID=UPI002350F313|nr:LytTR family transcriptional regulator [Aureisphaera galaxeae]MDC8005871.1 LytTR family transcriptional regulator [Aureisphaera galaxeae]